MTLWLIKGRFSFTFLGAFAKLRKATVSSVMSCLSVRMEQLGSHSTDFHEIVFPSFFKSVEKIQVSLKSDRNNGHFIYVMTYTHF